MYAMNRDLMRPRWGKRGDIPTVKDIDLHIILLLDAIHPSHLCLLSLSLSLLWFNLPRKFSGWNLGHRDLGHPTALNTDLNESHVSSPTPSPHSLETLACKN